MAGTTEGGHIDLVKFSANKGIKKRDLGVYEASLNDYFDVTKFINKNFQLRVADLDYGMYTAVRGHFEIVKFFVEKGVTNWTRG